MQRGDAESERIQLDFATGRDPSTDVQARIVETQSDAESREKLVDDRVGRGAEGNILRFADGEDRATRTEKSGDRRDLGSAERVVRRRGQEWIDAHQIGCFVRAPLTRVEVTPASPS